MKMKVRVMIPGKETVILCPEDQIDLGDNGLILWISEPMANAVRIIQKESMKKVQEAVKFVEGKK